MAANDREMLALFKRDPAQAYELFKAACKIADDERAALEKARGGGPTFQDAIAAALKPQAEAVAKATHKGQADSNFQAGRAREAILTKSVEDLAKPAADPHDLTARTRLKRQLKKATKS